MINLQLYKLSHSSFTDRSWDAKNIKIVYVYYILLCFNIFVYTVPGDGGRPEKK
jgi:hypothetical protein